MKKVVFVFLLTMIVGSSNLFAYEFKAISPSGHRLRFSTELEYSNYYNSGPTDVCVKRTYDSVPSGDLIIPDTVMAPNGYKYIVREISESAFEPTYGPNGDTASMIAISSVVIPSTVRYIGVRAFMGNPKLRTVTFGDSPITISVDAFAYCTSLKSVIIPNLWDCYNSFEGCSGLEYLEIKGGEGDFIGTYFPSLKYIYVNCKRILRDGGAETIRGDNLREIVIGDNLTIIQPGAFLCDSLKKLTIGKSMGDRQSTFGPGAFLNCISLDTIIFRCNEIHSDYHPFTEVKPGVNIIVPCGQSQFYSECEIIQNCFAYPIITEDCSNVGLDEIEDIENPLIYAKDSRIHLQNAGGLDGVVYDINGRLITIVKDGQNTQSLPAGVYIVKVGTLPSRKVVIIH